LSDEEMLAIPQMLGCTRWGEINALLAGGVMSAWEAAPATVAPAPASTSTSVPAATSTPTPVPARWAGVRNALARWPARAGIAVLALLIIVVLAFQLRSTPVPAPDQFGSVVVSTSPPAGGPPDRADFQESCVYSAFQSVARRRDSSGNWKNVGVVGAAPDLAPEVIATLDEVSFCEGQIKLSWSLRNNLDDQTVTLPLNAANVVVRDSLGNDYPIDEKLSQPSEIRAAPDGKGRGTIVIDRPASLNAQTLVIKLKQLPFGETTWLAPIRSGSN
jgi:hypothetical protein